MHFSKQIVTVSHKLKKKYKRFLVMIKFKLYNNKDKIHKMFTSAIIKYII